MEFNGSVIKDEISSGVQAMQNKLQRYEALRMMYKGEPKKARPAIKNGVTLHYPIVQPVLDTLTAHVVNTITSESPNCIPRCYETEDAEEFLSQTLQFFSEKDKLKNKLKQVGPPTGYSNVGIIEARWDDENCAFEWDIIPASSFVVYPSWSQSLGECKFCGHKFQRRRSEIEELQKTGFYEKVEIIASSTDDSQQGASAASRNIPSHAVTQADEAIEIWRLLYKVGKKYWQIIITENGAILRKEEWTYGKCNYFAFSYKPKDIEDGFWPTNSVANDIQELQLTANVLISDAINGQRMGMFGVGLAPNGVDTNQAYIEYEPGSMLQGIAEGSLHFPSVNISYTLPILTQVIQQANEAARLADTTRGTQSKASKTATQSELEAMGSQRAIDEYIENFGATVVEIFEFMQAVLVKHYSKWVKKYGKHLGLDEVPDAKEYLSAPALWSLNVASIGATPSAMIALVERFVALANDPEFKFDKYKMGELLLSLGNRLGLTNADDLQYPDDPLKLAELLAQELEKQGVDGSIVLAAVAASIQLSSPGGMGGVPEQSMLPMDGQGMGAEPGVPQGPAGTGEGFTGFDQSGVM